MSSISLANPVKNIALGGEILKSRFREDIFVHCLSSGKYIIMEMTIIIFERRGLIKEMEEKDDIKLLEIPRMTKGYLSLEILKEVRMGISGRSVPRPAKTG
jgi:hypothetical protein